MKGLPYAGDISNPAGSIWDILWILFVLSVIVGLIILLLRFLAKKNRNWGMNRSLRSLGGFPLGANKSMQIVEWNGRIYVLGIGENITLLESIVEPELVASLLAEHDTSHMPTVAGLPDWLRKWSQKRSSNAAGIGPTESEDHPSFEQTLEHRLRQLAERRQRVEQLLEDQTPEDRSGKP